MYTLEDAPVTLETFYAGLFTSNRFFPDSEHHGASPEDCSHETRMSYISRQKVRDYLALRLMRGIVILQLEASRSLFGLEIHNSCERSPGIAIILLEETRLSLNELIVERIKEPVREVVQDKASGVLASGELVSTALSKGGLRDEIPLYMLEVR